MLGVEESFRVLTVHNTTQSVTAHQVIVLCCNTGFKEILYNAYHHHGQAPTVWAGQITLRPCSSKTSILHTGVQTYSSGFCDVLHYRAETTFETVNTKYSHKQEEQIDKVSCLCSSTLTHKMPTTEILILKTWCHLRSNNYECEQRCFRLLWSFRLVEVGD